MSAVKRVDRYLLRVIIPSVIIGVSFYLSLFLVRAFFEIVELSLRQGIPFFKAIYIVLLTMPALLVMTIPMGILFAYIYAISSLQQTNELLGLMSLGFTKRQIMRPFIYVAILLALINAIVQIYILPKSNETLVTYRLSLLRSAISKNIQPRQFIEGFANKIVYAEEMDTSKSNWTDVIILEYAPPQHRIISAEKGNLFMDPTGLELWLKLSDVTTHITNIRKSASARYQINTNEEQSLLLKRISPDVERSFDNKGLLELSLPELIQRTQEARSDLERRRAVIELNRKATFPVACLLFAWLALTYALRKPHMKGAAAFTFSLAFIILYYVVMAIGEDLATQGKFNPILASWGPGFIIFIVGLYYVLKGKSTKKRFWERNIRLKIATDITSQIQGLKGFPTKIDTYIWTRFLLIFLMVMSTLVALYLVIDFTQIIDEIQRHNVSLLVVLQYYLYSLPQLIYEQASPISLLVALALTIGILERGKEFTAMRSLGISLHRTVLPFLFVAIAFSIVGFSFGETLLPLSNSKMLDYRQIIRGKDPGKIQGIPGDYHLVMTGGDHLVGYTWADLIDESLHDVFILEWNDSMKFQRRLFASTLLWRNSHWIMVDGWEREFDGDTVTSFKRFNRRDYPFVDSRDDLLLETSKPQEMNFYALKNYIRRAKASGHTNPALDLHLWKKVVPPLAMIVLAFFAYGLVFRFPTHQTTTLRLIGMSLGAGIFYWALIALFYKLGELGALPPLLAATAPVGLIFLLSLYNYFDIKT